MSRKCKFCGKGPVTGNQVSKSNVKTRIRWLPNVRKLKAVVKGTTKRVRACTRCIRTGLIVKPKKEKYVHI